MTPAKENHGDHFIIRNHNTFFHPLVTMPSLPLYINIHVYVRMLDGWMMYLKNFQLTDEDIAQQLRSTRDVTQQTNDEMKDLVPSCGTQCLQHFINSVRGVRHLLVLDSEYHNA